MPSSSSPSPSFDGTTLPRSIRWRLQLGLLKMPDASHAHASGDQQQQQQQPANTLQGLQVANSDLLKEQRERYDQLVLRYDGDRHHQSTTMGDDDDSMLNPEVEQQQDLQQQKQSTNTCMSSLDPLSLMIHQQDLREEKEARQRVSRRKSSMVDIVRSQEITTVVKKDLNRLSNDHASYYRSRANWKHHMGEDDSCAETDFEKAVQERNALLTEILHVYGKDHVLPGYQQGMHEICSYLMFVVEMDLFDVETSDCHDYADIMSADYLLHDTFTMTEAILTEMEHAFGVAEEGHEKPVEEMGDSILHKVQYVARDKNLYMHLQSMEWSLELYCARWVRLLFAREVGGWRDVLSLWDIFLDCITKIERITSMLPSKYTRPGLDKLLRLGEFELMAVLETTAASFLWLCREQLLSRQADEGLQAVTGMDPLKDVGPLISTLLSSLRRLQISKTMAPLLHPDQKKVSNTTTTTSGKNRSPLHRSSSMSRVISNRAPLHRASSMSRIMTAAFPTSNGAPPSPATAATTQPKRRPQRRRSSLQHFAMPNVAEVEEKINEPKSTSARNLQRPGLPPSASPASSSHRTMTGLVSLGANYLFPSENSAAAIVTPTNQADHPQPKAQRMMRRTPDGPTEETTKLTDLDKTTIQSQPVISDEETLKQSFHPLEQSSAPPAPLPRQRARRRSSLHHDSSFAMAQAPTEAPPPRQRARRRSSLQHFAIQDVAPVLDPSDTMTELVDLDKNHMLSQPVISDEEILRLSFHPLAQSSAPSPRQRARRRSSLNHDSSFALAHAMIETPPPRQMARRRSSLNHDSSFAITQPIVVSPTIITPPSIIHRPQRAKRRSSLGSMSSWMATSANTMSAAMTSTIMTTSVVVRGASLPEESASPSSDNGPLEDSSNEVVANETMSLEQQRRMDMVYASPNMRILLNTSPLVDNHQLSLFDSIVTDSDQPQLMSMDKQQSPNLKLLLSTSPPVVGDSLS